MKFIKFTALWLAALMATLVLTGVFAWLSLDSLSKIAISTLLGYGLLLVVSFFLTGFGGVSLRGSAWSCAGVHVIANTFVGDNDALFLIGPLVGIAICYWLVRVSAKILTPRPAEV
jgi:hypothetical protein